MTSMLSRREFVQYSAAAAACVAAARPAAWAQAPSASRYQFCAFTKFLQSLSFDKLADAVVGAGFHGVEAPVREGGHFPMAEAGDKLPQLVEALGKKDVSITILCTDVLRADQPHAEECLRSAASLGIKYYRMGFYKYDLAKSVQAQLAEIRPAIVDLAALNRELGMQAVYQNHSGADHVGAAVWDAYEFLRDVPPQDVALAFDIRHATIEAGLAWPAVFNAVSDHIGAIFVKDFQWDGDSAQHVPLGEGRVDRKFFDLLEKSDFSGPVSLHVEYLGDRDAAENAAALRQDYATLREWMDV
jgi:sugar phosphate isomerase/epimerase